MEKMWMKNELLMAASMTGNVDEARQLLSLGANGDWIWVTSGYSPFLVAAKDGHEEICRILIKYGSDVNQQHPLTGDTALSYAAGEGHLSTVLTLISLGARVDIQAHTGFTPLAFASQQGHLAVVLSLLQAGANRTLSDKLGAPSTHKAAGKLHAPVLMVLLEHGCHVEQTDFSDRTPLMAAALSGADDAVKLLLRYGADPNKMDREGQTALVAAIEASVTSTMDILAPVTSIGYSVVQTLVLLAKYHQAIEITQPLRNFLKRCSKNEDVLDKGIMSACTFGAVNMFNCLALHPQKVKRCLGVRLYLHGSPYQEFKNVLLHLSLIWNAVMSDSAVMCQKILNYNDYIPEEVKAKARERGNTDVIEVITGRSDFDKDEVKHKLKTTVINKTAGILDLIPRFVEFKYESKKDKILPLLKQDTLTYSVLLEKLQAPKVHIEMKCPLQCPDKLTCHRIREAFRFVKKLVSELEGTNPFYKGMKVKLVGSMSENTRVFDNNEMDMHISLDEKSKHLFTFDKKEQIVITQMPYYTKENNEFDTESFFFDFLRNLYKSISNVQTEPGSNMKPVTTDYFPCLRCISTEWSPPQAFRCRHTKDCEAHDDTCDCSQFTSPALSHTRSGAVLHLEWAGEDGGRFNIDIDLVPILPISTPYNGDITPAVQHLCEKRPVGWVDDITKLRVERMTDAAYLPHLKNEDQWHINMRMINRHRVLPRKSIPFINDQTLEGDRRSIYTILKVLKYCTNSPIKSYMAKFAMDVSKIGKKIDTIELRAVIIRAMSHFFIRNKFLSIHPDLRKEGIIRVEVGDEELDFMKECDLEGIPEQSQELEALKEKERGNSAYKIKNFDKGITHYEMALHLDMKEIVYWNNLAAVMFELKAFKECCWLCEMGIKMGRRNNAEKEKIAKAQMRINKARKMLSQTQETGSGASMAEATCMEHVLTTYCSDHVNQMYATLDQDAKSKLLLALRSVLEIKQQDSLMEMLTGGPSPGKHDQDPVLTKALRSIGTKTILKDYSKLKKVLESWGKPKPFIQAVSEHHQLIVERKAMEADKNACYRRKITSQACSKTFKSVDFTNLEKIFIRDLKLFQTATGKYLEGRIVTPPVLFTVLTTLLEDENGDYVQLGLYNVVTSGPKRWEIAEKKFPVGMKIKISQPFYKIFVDGNPGIRVDTPAEVYREIPNTKLTVEELRSRGKELMEAGEYLEALELYLEGLKTTQIEALLNNLRPAFY